LKAAEKMAIHMNDKTFAGKCHRLYKNGSQWTDQNLFNGEYYVHKIEVPKNKEAIAKGLVGANRLKGLDLNDPYYQLGTGCLVDQLVGQYMAHFLDSKETDFRP
jgi:non-lysosomal glucosylceramidase